MSTGHNYYMSSSGFGHHFGFEIAAVHSLQIGNNRHTGKSFTKFPDAVKAFIRATIAGLRRLLYDGYIAGFETIVVFLTASGFKYVESMEALARL